MFSPYHVITQFHVRLLILTSETIDHINHVLHNYFKPWQIFLLSVVQRFSINSPNIPLLTIYVTSIIIIHIILPFQYNWQIPVQIYTCINELIKIWRCDVIVNETTIQDNVCWYLCSAKYSLLWIWICSILIFYKSDVVDTFIWTLLLMSSKNSQDILLIQSITLSSFQFINFSKQHYFCELTLNCNGIYLLLHLNNKLCKNNLIIYWWT